MFQLWLNLTDHVLGFVVFACNIASLLGQDEVFDKSTLGELSFKECLSCHSKQRGVLKWWLTWMGLLLSGSDTG